MGVFFFAQSIVGTETEFPRGLANPVRKSTCSQATPTPAAAAAAPHIRNVVCHTSGDRLGGCGPSSPFPLFREW